MDVPELKPQKMLVSDAGYVWSQRWVLGKLDGRFIAISDAEKYNTDFQCVTKWKHAIHLPPEGYRLVTAEERERYCCSKYKCPAFSFYDACSERWILDHGDKEIQWFIDLIYAVPEDYVFGEQKVAVKIGDKEGYISQESAEELKRMLA